MPTARELLEQADALMTRNRAREQEPDIPELTDEVAVAVAALPARESPKPSHSAPRPRQVRADDLPELHDAVEELSIQPLPDDEGEVSRWPEGGLGEVSITGPAPDSIAVVPPSTLRVRPPVPKVETPPQPAAEHREPPAPAPVLPPTAAASLVAAHVAGTLTGKPAEPPPPSDPAFEAMLGASPVETSFEWDPAPPPGAAPPPEPVTSAAPSPEPVASATLPPEPVTSAAAEFATLAVPEPEMPPAAPATEFPDAQRLEALAEEIRMQVLQRIDIFTDTGLHGELSARLQPIVDRASADLVTTINREVGQILRTYVAEAIEREIEKWREANP
jgi:hypothetical protein